MNSLRKWHIDHSELVLDNRWAKVRRDKCVTPTGVMIDDYYYWEGGDFAQVFAITPASEVVFVRQYKHGVKEIVTELPAGLISRTDSDAASAARRELLEETGFGAQDWRPMGTLHVSSAKSTTLAFEFLATFAEPISAPSPDPMEQIEVVLVPCAEVLNLIAKGVVRDSNSIAGCLLALGHLGLVSQCPQSK